jgi:hypothetical protein
MHMASDRIRACVDRSLSENLLLRSAEVSIDERAANAPEGLNGARTRRQRLRLAVETGKMWSNGRVLRVSLLGSPPVAHGKIAAIATEWTRYANLHLEFVSDPRTAELRVAFEAGPSWSLVGTEALAAPIGEPTMNLGWLTEDDPEAWQPLILHEFGHALGCLHEHSSPTAGIPWDLPAVYRYYGGPPNRWTSEEIERNVLARYAKDRVRSTAFDPASIMLYPISAALTGGKYKVGLNTSLSPLDHSFIKECYPATDLSVTALPSDGTSVNGHIATPDSVQQFRFAIVRPGDYRLETSGHTDLKLRIFGPGRAPKALADADDGGLGGNVRIDVPLMPGDYRVEVRHRRSTGTGRYVLALHELTAR